MGFYNRTEKNKKLNWTDLTSIDQFSELIQSGKKILIFKHSTRCIISKMALNQLEDTWSGPQENIYFLDLLNHRDISNRIAEELKIIHQSPQAIVFQRDVVLYHDSHANISASAIEKKLK